MIYHMGHMIWDIYLNSLVHAVSAGAKMSPWYWLKYPAVLCMHCIFKNNQQRKTLILLILKFRLTYNATFTKIKIIPFLK